MPRELTAPWRAFFLDLDALLTHEVALRCLGGFVLASCHGLPRPTGDVDVLSVVPDDDAVPLDLAELERRYRDEMRPYLGVPDREDLTLKLWVEAITERRQVTGPGTKSASAL